MWKYSIIDFKLCDILRPGARLSYNIDRGGICILDCTRRYGEHPTFIRWVTERCQNSCEIHHDRELLILSSSGEERKFHPLWFIECKKCRYYK